MDQGSIWCLLLCKTRGSEFGGFDISSLISCFTAAWRLTLMHGKDVALTAHQHIHVQSPPYSKILRTENNPFWKAGMEVGEFNCSFFWKTKLKEATMNLQKNSALDVGFPNCSIPCMRKTKTTPRATLEEDEATESMNKFKVLVLWRANI